MLQGVTWFNRVLHGFTGCYMVFHVLHGVTGCYTVLEVVTRVNRVLLGVTGCLKGQADHPLFVWSFLLLKSEHRS